ncbi:MAG TPA: nucleotide exchange factor GrpE [Candidatus Saccharimonadales bacterium]|nr:nucleotide exchange factor GrpE [Candidatus Saccharimonadales bacterium]
MTNNPQQSSNQPNDDYDDPLVDTDELETLEDAVQVQYEELEQQIANLTDALQRERADVINIRRRHDEQVTSLKTHIKAGVVRELLPIIDNFERALKHVPEEFQKNDYIKGVQSIVKQFEKTLADMGVVRIKTVGVPFDPNLHEAVSMEEGDGDTEIVSEELQAGYQLDDEVLRHAMVRVKMA